MVEFKELQVTEITICPHCKRENPPSALLVDARELGYLYIEFKCCAHVWKTEILNIGIKFTSRNRIPNPKYQTN